MRNQLALARRAKVVIERFDGFGREGRASPMKIAQQFLLFRIDGNHRIASSLILASYPRNVFKLGVAVGMMAHRFFLPCRAAAYLEFAQQPSDRPPTGGCPQRQQTA